MRERPPGRGELREFLTAQGLEPSRALGQNFVVDANTTERIVRLAGVIPGQQVLEIGAGLGALTLALVGAGARVTALEIDRRLLPHLRSELGERAHVVEGDALQTDLGALLDEGEEQSGAPTSPRLLVANLPYNVATPVVMRVLEEFPQIDRLFVMVQREVGERLIASPGSKEYGAVSVRVAYFATAALVGRVSPEVFHPRPHVESALVEITRRSSPAVGAEIASYAEIKRLVRAGFATRRKMLRRALAGLVDDAAFVAAGVAPTDRAESLDVLAWGKLAQWARPDPSTHAPN